MKPERTWSDLYVNRVTGYCDENRLKKVSVEAGRPSSRVFSVKQGRDNGDLDHDAQILDIF